MPLVAFEKSLIIHKPIDLSMVDDISHAASDTISDTPPLISMPCFIRYNRDLEFVDDDERRRERSGSRTSSKAGKQMFKQAPVSARHRSR